MQPYSPQPDTNYNPASHHDGGYEKNRRLTIIATILILVLVVLGLWYIWYKKNHPKEATPLERLQQLEESSRPINATPSDRSAQLDSLEKSSTPVKATPSERTQELNALNQ